MTVTISKSERVVFSGLKLVVYWLALPGDTLPSKKEYAREIDESDAEASFRAIDRLVSQEQPVPRNFMSPIKVDKSLKLWEIRAPHRGREIGRLLAYRDRDWDLYLGLCGKKKSQELPKQWIDTASQRVRRSLDGGGP